VISDDWLLPARSAPQPLQVTSSSVMWGIFHIENKITIKVKKS